MAKKKQKDISTGAEVEVEANNKITVVSRQTSGRYACYGRYHFTNEPQDVEVTDDDLKEIQADPMLLIVSPKPEAPAA